MWDELRENSEVKSAPASVFTTAKEDVTRMYTNFAELSGTTVEELLAQFDMEEGGIDELANDTVAEQMIAKTIAAKEGLTMDDAYYEAKLREMLGSEEDEETAKMTLEELEKEYRETVGSRPRDDMLVERVRDYVGEQAKEADAVEEDE